MAITIYYSSDDGEDKAEAEKSAFLPCPDRIVALLQTL